MPFQLPPESRPKLRHYATHPWTKAARHSPGLRAWCDQHGYITPHFTWASYACQDATHTPVPDDLKANAIRFHWDLEKMRHLLGDQPMVVDGPYRTKAHNTAVHGAPDSRHIHADGGDFFAAQVDSWIAASPELNSRSDILDIADVVFANGGLGNENSGTLHVDSRGSRARFVTWTHT